MFSLCDGPRTTNTVGFSITRAYHFWMIQDGSSPTQTTTSLTGALEGATRIIETIPQGIWRANPDGVADFCSQRFCDMVGYGKEKLLGNGWSQLIHPDDQPNVLAVWMQACRDKKPVSVEFRIRLPSGEDRWFLSLGNLYLGPDGEVIKFYGTWTDIHADKLLRTELENRTLALETSKAEAERANEMKSVFLANMSHEIRTPLGAMLGFADLLRDSTLSIEDHAHYLEILLRNGRQLSVIIDDILDLSKVEAGYLTLEVVPMSPVEIATGVITFLENSATEKNLTLNYIREPSTPDSVWSDPVRVRQVLTNLIGNAIKFTPKGTITLRSYSESSAGKTSVYFEIKDSGIGISESQRDRIFDNFVQADGSMTRRFGGTGLGLALSRRLADALGGKIELTASVPGEGSSFSFSFADQKLANTQAGFESSEIKTRASSAASFPGARALEGFKILIVDDTADNQLLIGRMLTQQGARIESATDGLEGCSRALRGDFDLVLMDIQMPQMDGYTATKHLRDQGFARPIIALTAHAMQDVRQKALSVGCTDLLTKPIDRDQLIAKIVALVD